MPLPKPKQGESQSDFMERCMHEAMKGTDDQKQGVAMCMRQWREKESNMRSWYEIKAQQDSADLYIYDEIGGFGVPASSLVKELRGVKGKSLNVYINSPGGSVFDSVAIYNALHRHEGGVNVTVDGVAASGASIVTQAGDKRKMALGSSMMIHDAWGVAVGGTATMATMSDELNKLSDSIADIYADRAGGTSEEWRARMAAETWYKAEDAVTAGLADEAVVGHVALNAYAGRVFNLSKFSKVPDWVNQAAPDEPSTQQPGQEPEPSPKEDTMDEQVIRQALGLDADGDPIAAIKALRTRVDVSEAILKADAPDKLEVVQLRSQLQQAQGELLSLKTQHAEEILTLRDEMRKSKASTMVESAIQAGHVLPADRQLAYDLAYNNEEAFEQFRSRQRVDLRERGSANVVDGIELTEDELRVAASMDVSREQLIRQKAADKGIKLPS